MMMILPLSRRCHFTHVVAAILSLRTLTTAQEVNVNGSPLCPCLTELPSPLSPADETILMGRGVIDMTVHGIGCHAHDEQTLHCTATDSCHVDAKVFPGVNEALCDRSWCPRRWCYVDHQNCQLNTQQTSDLSHRLPYSYATCGDLDSFTAASRLATLQGKTFRVGLNANSGGWTGAYRDPRVQFEGPTSAWSGPALDFAKQGAIQAGFEMKLVNPFEELPLIVNKSQEYFGSSSFDLCVYAASLGYVDFCISQYSITDRRVEVVDFFVLQSDPLYLLVQRDDEGSNWERFKDVTVTLFSPYALQTWLFVLFFVVPMMGLLVFYHESHIEGSEYCPTEEVETEDGYKEKVQHPWYKAVNLALYRGLLSLFQRGYRYPFKSYGAAWMVLAITFFSLLFMSVFTAKLASQLTERALRPSVDSLQAAIDAGYRFCGERKRIDTVLKLYPGIDQSFVVDPVELDGDGLPGFNCPKCKALTRAIDFIDPVKASAGDPNYCHGALVTAEDLEVRQRDGMHCDKALVGAPITYVSNGFPVSERVSTEIISWFTQLKNRGLFDQIKISSMPLLKCPVWTERSKTGSFKIYHLSGIWIVTFGFATISLFVSLWEYPLKDRKYLERFTKQSKATVKGLHDGTAFRRRRKDDQQQQAMEQSKKARSKVPSSVHVNQTTGDVNRLGSTVPAFTIDGSMRPSFHDEDSFRIDGSAPREA